MANQLFRVMESPSAHELILFESMVHGVANVEEGRLHSLQVDDAVESSFGLVGDELEDRETS